MIMEKPKNASMHFFEQTLPLSTYLYAVMAGPFMGIHKITSENGASKIPMSLYCRQSMLQYLQAEAAMMFELVEKGIEFFEEFFGTPFPFDKYDMIFCPEYN
mgnify:CR=1 FL=1